jgi:ribosome-associated protein
MHPSHKAFWEHHSINYEVRLNAVTAGGKGGQHVNKVSTKIQLSWSLKDSVCLTEAEKSKIATHLKNKLTTSEELIVSCEESRSQLQNKKLAFSKFHQLLANCFKIQKLRKSTQPTGSSIKKRLKSKEIRSVLKKLRNKPPME